LLDAELGQGCFGLFDGAHWYLGTLRAESSWLPPAFADQVFTAFKEIDNHADIDFIHGWEDTKQLCTAKAVAVFLPVIGRERFFKQVQERGPLPRKAFSLGEAEEKRYYLEARRIME
jgi:hypothetical protein